eukprot:3735696-Lingulodinium_polyedra.AAC.1
MADLATEQAIRRAALMQALVTGPGAQVHAISAFWGKAEVDKDAALDDSGKLIETASPWAVKMWE